MNLETLQQSCRVCLQKGDINIWDFKVKMTNPNEINSHHSAFMEAVASTETSHYLDILELINIFSGAVDILELSEDVPLLCWECLEELKLSYRFYEKLRNASTRLKQAYNKCLSEFIEEEHLIESPEGETKVINEYVVSNELVHVGNEVINHLGIEEMGHVSNEEISDDAIEYLGTDVPKPKIVKTKRNRSGSCRSLGENSSLVVTQFVPSTTKFVNARRGEDNEEYPEHRNLLTVDCKVVEVKDVAQLESLENLPVATSPAVYMCQYCPQAFSKSEFLTLHLQKTHICKFCTQPFRKAALLYQHIREVHTEHKCVICEKMLSSTTNLRHHIKRVHRIKLPAKMTLLNFIQSAEEEVINGASTTDTMSQMDEIVEYTEGQFESSIYFSKTGDVVDDMELK